MLNTKTSVEIVPSSVGGSYPYFGMNEMRTIILFVRKNTGTILSNNSNQLGTFSEHWIEDEFPPINVQEITFTIEE